MARLTVVGQGSSRRGFVQRAGVGAAALAVVTLGRRAAGAQGTPDAATPAATPSGADGRLTVYSGRSENLVDPILADFALDAGVDLEVRYASTSELAATLLEEGGNSPASAFFAQDAGALGLLAAEGLLAPLPPAILDRVPERFHSPDGLWVGVSGRARTLVYNTDELEPAALPASVLDLTAEEWAGQIGWAPENASFQSFVTAMRLLLGDEATRAWLDAMIANGTVGFADSNSAIVQAVGRGEISAGLVNHYYVYAAKRDEGEAFPVANHSFAPGDPGSLVNVAGVAVLAAAPDPDQAVPLVEFLLGDEAQTYFATETSEYPLVAGVASPVGLPPISEIGSPEIDLSDLADPRGTLDLLAEVGLL